MRNVTIGPEHNRKMHDSVSCSPPRLVQHQELLAEEEASNLSRSDRFLPCDFAICLSIYFECIPNLECHRSLFRAGLSRSTSVWSDRAHFRVSNGSDQEVRQASLFSRYPSGFWSLSSKPYQMLGFAGHDDRISCKRMCFRGLRLHVLSAVSPHISIHVFVHTENLIAFHATDLTSWEGRSDIQTKGLIRSSIV